MGCVNPYTYFWGKTVEWKLQVRHSCQNNFSNSANDRSWTMGLCFLQCESKFSSSISGNSVSVFVNLLDCVVYLNQMRVLNVLSFVSERVGVLGRAVNQSLVSKMGTMGVGLGHNIMVLNTYLSWGKQRPWCDFWKLYIENIHAYILAVRIGLKMATSNYTEFEEHQRNFAGAWF